MIREGEIRWGSDGPRGFGTPEALEAMSKDIHDWVRQVRGGFLSGAFAIERNLNAAIIHYFLGSRVAIDEVQDTFDAGILQSLTFDRRISIGKLIADQCMTAEAGKSINDGLRSVQGIRNVMAHQPFGLSPQFRNDGSLYCLTPFMKHGKGTLILTTAFVHKQNDLMKRMIDGSQRLIMAVLVKGGLALPEGAKRDDIALQPSMVCSLTRSRDLRMPASGC